MRKACLLPLAAVAVLSTPAQVSITPLLPTGAAGSNYGILVLAGSQRNISAILRGSTSMQVNWSVINSYGGGSATLDRTTNAIPLVNVTVGSTPGNCTSSGTLGAYTVSSTVGFTVRATSVDDATKYADYPFKVCANTTAPAVQPAYQQSFASERVSLQSYIIGNTNEAGTWSITSQPSGGDGTLADTNKRDALFTAAVPGRYVLTFTSAADTSKSATAIVYIAGAQPAWGLSTPNLTASYPCAVDPAFSGTTFEVGAGYAYATPADANVAFVNAAPGSIMRIHNTDTGGTAASTFHNYLYFDGQGKGGTATQPKIVCGVPDLTGHLPVLDAANATGKRGSASYGVVNIWGNQNVGGTYAAGSIGPSYMTVAGLEIKNATEMATYSDFNNAGTMTSYGDFAACVNVRSGWYQQFVGLDLHNCRNGIYTQSNGAYGFSTVTKFFYYRGSHFKNNSKSFVAGQHHIYNSTWYPVYEGNFFEDLVPFANGNMVKDRGQQPIYRYNAMLTSNGGYMHAVNAPTDSPQYFTAEAYLGGAGDTSCQSLKCGGDNTISMNDIAANQEELFKAFYYGGIYAGRGTGIALIQFADSEGNAGYDTYNQSEVSDHLGRHHFYSNTVDNPGQGIFSTFTIGYDDPAPFKPTIIAQNNIFYKARTGTINLFSLVNHSSISMVFRTNLFNASTVDLTKPIVNRQFNAHTTAVNGWVSITNKSQYDWNGVTTDNNGFASATVSIDKHQTGIDSTNFLFTTSTNHKPYNSATYAPVPSSEAIGAATAAVDPEMALMPVRSQYSMELHRVIPRTATTTLGAVDTGSQPTLSSMALSAEVAAFLANRTGTCPYYFDSQKCLPLSTEAIYIPIPMSLKGTWSNGLISNVGPDATWTSSAATFFSNNEMIPNTSPASGKLTATFQGITMVQPFGYAGGIPPALQDVINSVFNGASSLSGSGQIQ